MGSWKDEVTRWIRVRRWKFHLGRTTAAAAMAFVALAVGFHLGVACAIGAFGLPLLYGYKAFHAKYSHLDYAAVWIQYQPVWLIYFLLHGQLVRATLAAVAISVLYLGTLIWSEP